MLINDFFANREVFITGGTGFLGKSLIEKLLRDCPKIKVLYVLLRCKKSLGIEERLEQFKKDKVFDLIHQKCPEVLNKLHAIQGDSEMLGLGIRPTDLSLLQSVSVIFHMAANVKFDDPLRSSILINTRGTYELIKIAENLKNLIVFMHCSTAFCNPFKDVVEEKVYDMPVYWLKAIKIAETCDENTLNSLFYKYTSYYPNTYTFSKNLSEQIIQEYSKKIPMCIFRPAVVTNAYKEPVAGWIDNLNGPVALMVGISIGIIPVAICNGDLALDTVPIDMVTKLTIVAAYKRGMQFLRKEPVPEGIEVVNCTFGQIYEANFKQLSTLYYKAVRKNPMENMSWDFDFPIITSCYYNFLLKMLLLGVPLALVQDTILRFMRRNPMMVKMSRRIVFGTKAVMFFTFKKYQMINKNMLDLEDSIPQSELPIYGVKADIADLDLEQYVANALRGVKTNLFNHPPQATAAAHKRAKILFIVSRSIKFFTFTLFVLYLWSIVCTF